MKPEFPPPASFLKFHKIVANEICLLGLYLTENMRSCTDILCIACYGNFLSTISLCTIQVFPGNFGAWNFPFFLQCSV